MAPCPFLPILGTRALVLGAWLPAVVFLHGDAALGPAYPRSSCFSHTRLLDFPKNHNELREQLEKPP